MVGNVRNVTSLTRSGLADFILQRVSAVIIAFYAMCVTSFFYDNPELSHATLVGYFGHPGMRLFSTLAVLSIAAHAWIGMWTVGTDYIRPHYFGRHATSWRLAYQGGCVIALFIFVAWTLALFWSL